MNIGYTPARTEPASLPLSLILGSLHWIVHSSLFNLTKIKEPWHLLSISMTWYYPAPVKTKFCCRSCSMSGFHSNSDSGSCSDNNLCPESTAGLRDHLWCAVQFVIRTKHGSRLADRTHVCFVVNRPWRVICIRTWHCCHYFILIWPSWFQTTWLVFVVLICLQSFISLKLTLIEGRIVCTLMSNAYVHYSTQEATTWRLPVGTQRCWNEI